MQVKRRLNQLFDSIRRKDRSEGSSEDEHSSRTNKKWKESKSGQNYSQWDLIDNIAADPSGEEDIFGQAQLEIRILPQEEFLTQQSYDVDEEVDLVEKNKRKSFLKRSGSLLRRSLRRNKKPMTDQVYADRFETENVADIGQEINEALVSVATFREGSDNGNVMLEHKVSNHRPTPCFGENSIEFEEGQFQDNDLTSKEVTEVHDPIEKFALRKGLQRQASKIMSKFRKAPGSLRLKSSASVDSLSNRTFPRRRWSASFSAANTTVDTPEVTDDKPTRKGSFRRKMSFKKAGKVMKKGVTSFGKNMIHASAVMPVAYECPPVSLYPDYEANYPSELEQCYYRTQSYLPKEWDDKMNLQFTRKPASFYQHGYCYNG